MKLKRGIGDFTATITKGGFWYRELIGAAFELKWNNTHHPILKDTPFNRSQLEELRLKSKHLNRVMNDKHIGKNDPIGFGILEHHIKLINPEDNHQALQVLYKEDWL